VSEHEEYYLRQGVRLEEDRMDDEVRESEDSREQDKEINKDKLAVRRRNCIQPPHYASEHYYSR
jgi:hypothetical protein